MAGQPTPPQRTPPRGGWLNSHETIFSIFQGYVKNSITCLLDMLLQLEGKAFAAYQRLAPATEG